MTPTKLVDLYDESPPLAGFRLRDCWQGFDVNGEILPGMARAIMRG